MMNEGKENRSGITLTHFLFLSYKNRLHAEALKAAAVNRSDKGTQQTDDSLAFHLQEAKLAGMYKYLLQDQVLESHLSSSIRDT